MLPAVALVGRPNVGKSTLFNRLTSTRDALVADFPGLTRDRRYGIGQHDDRRFIVIDTGGLAIGDEGDDDGARRRAGRPRDRGGERRGARRRPQEPGSPRRTSRIAERLRRETKPLPIAVNKAEGVLGEIAAAEFHALGLAAARSASPRCTAKASTSCSTTVLAPLPDGRRRGRSTEEFGPKVAVIGRPNVGKSTLINRLLGANRLITSPEPGTTRDSVLVPVRARRPQVRAHRHGGHSAPRTRERGDREVQHRAEPAGDRGRGRGDRAARRARRRHAIRTCT